MDSEGLAGLRWHWSTPRRFEAVYGRYIRLSGGVAGWRGVCYPEGMEFPREVVKRVVEVPWWGEVPALPSKQRLEESGMVHEDQSKTTRLRYRARLEGYTVEAYEARAVQQAVPTYGTRVVQLESVIEFGVIWVEVTVAW